MATPTDLTQCTATELLELYRRGDGVPGRGDAGRARADRHRRSGDSTPSASSPPTTAMASAAASEARWRRGEPIGPLDGVPTSIKDLILTRGWPTRRGSRTVDPDQPWDVDAPATARLREAGAVLIGKTTTPEFGCKGETNSSLTGITRNPWDPTKTSGGSSGGTAAAVAAGLRSARASAPTAPDRCASPPRSAATSGSSRASAGCRRTRCRRSAPCPTSARTR